MAEQAGEGRLVALHHWVELVQGYISRFAQPWHIDETGNSGRHVHEDPRRVAVDRVELPSEIVNEQMLALSPRERQQLVDAGGGWLGAARGEGQHALEDDGEISRGDPCRIDQSPTMRSPNTSDAALTYCTLPLTFKRTVVGLAKKSSACAGVRPYI